MLGLTKYSVHSGCSIHSYSIVALADSFYIFGGLSHGTKSSTIAAFSTVTKEWKKLGELKQARYYHGVIIQNGDFVVVGGNDGQLGTERCILSEDTITCTVIDPVLDHYYYYPEMMSVPPNYCLE